MKKVFAPTCRVCSKLNDTMTHCAIFGPVEPENVDSPIYAHGCVQSMDYVRLLHAVPNEHNYIDPKEIEGLEYRIYSCNSEDHSFSLRHGMTLEEWAVQVFSKNGGPSNETN